MEARIVTNPYQQYSPVDLLREWTTLQSSVDRNVHSVGEALKKRSPTDPPVGLSHVIAALEKNAAAMILIEDVVRQILEENRSYKVFGWDTGKDRRTVFTYITSAFNGILPVITAGILIDNAQKSEEDRNVWIPFGMTCLNTVAVVANDWFGWIGMEEDQRDICRLASVVNKDSLSYIHGIITSFRGMEKINRKLESDHSASENELERNLRAIEAFSPTQQFPVDVFVNDITKIKRAEPGSRLHAVAQLIIERNRRRHENEEMAQTASAVNWKKVVKERKNSKERSSDLLYEREETEQERKEKLMATFAEPTCCDWIVDSESALHKAMEIRANINTAIDAVDEEVGEDAQIDFSALIELLTSSKKELNDELLYVLDTFLQEEAKWRGTPFSKIRARFRSGIHYVANLATLVVLGIDGYREKNEDKQSTSLTVAATVMVIACAILGKCNDWMYKSLVEKRIRRGELERIQRHVETTIKRCDGLIPFYRNLQALRQQERALTLPEIEEVIEEANYIHRKYRGAATRCVKTVFKQHAIKQTPFEEGTPLVSRIQEIKSGEIEATRCLRAARKIHPKTALSAGDSDDEIHRDDSDLWRFNVERVQTVIQRARSISNASDASNEIRDAPDLSNLVHSSDV